MLQIRLVQEIYHTYLVLDIDTSSEKDNYGIKILQNNTPKYFVPFQLRTKNDVSEYYYDISGTQNLSTQLRKGFSDENIRIFVSALNKALEQCNEYLLDVDSILLEDSCIFYDSEQQTYFFVYYPGYNKNILGQLKDMAEHFLKNVDYTSNESVRKVYEFYHLVCGDENPLRKLTRFSGSDPIKSPPPKIDEDKNEPSLKKDGGIKFTDDSSDILFKNQGSYPDPENTDGVPDTGGDQRKNIIKLWLFVVIAIFLEIGVTFAVYQRLPQYNYRLYAIIGGIIILITLLTGLIITLKLHKSEDKKDFWSPEDYINYDTELTDSTTLLSDPSNRAVTKNGVTLRSTSPQRYPNMYIHTFPAIIGKEVTEPSCCIKEATVSRKHARLEHKGRQFRLTDLRSSNGTFINGEQIPPMEAMEIHSGDSIIFSDLEFVFEISETKE